MNRNRETPAPDLESRSARARLIAFYLPQFHPIPENDLWWGKGFTEWTNVAKAKPLFPGHYQPHVPADLGFYDLRVPETRLAQAELAREHGIEGFCYWHYWFAGDRLLERPFNEVLKSGEPDLPFCLAWANDTWTGVWHGAPKSILKEQTYPGMRDHEAHFYTLLKAFQDPRYMTVDGKPIFMVYKPLELPDSVRVTDYWRELAVKNGLPGLHLVAIGHDPTWSPCEHGFDAVTLSNQTRLTGIPMRNPIRKLTRKLRRDSPVASLMRKVAPRPVHVYSYEEALPYFVSDEKFAWDYYPCVVPNWDNTPRSGLNGYVLHGSTPELFRKQLANAIQKVESKPEARRIVIVKSWNEWAEGNYLEPDALHGLGYLRAVQQEVLSRETLAK